MNFCFWLEEGQAVIAHAFNPRTREAGRYIFAFKTSLVYRVSSKWLSYTKKPYPQNPK